MPRKTKTIKMYTYPCAYTPTLSPPLATDDISMLAEIKKCYDGRFVDLLKRNAPFTEVSKRRKLPFTPTIRQYSDFANFSDLKVNLTWRGYIKKVSTIPAATVYHMLYVDMGQEW